MSERPRTATQAIKQTEGNVVEAARIMGMARGAFRAMLEQEAVAAALGEAPAEELTLIEEHHLRREIKRAKGERDTALKELETAQARVAVLEKLEGVELSPPEWTVKTPKDKVHHAIVTAFLSDTHFDEVVKASEMGGVNAYDRSIALLRLQKFFRGVIKLSSNYIAGVKIDGLVLPLGGDMVSGNIHEELERTNEHPILDTVDFWPDQIAAGIELLLQYFPKVHVPCVVGNHGRLRKQKSFKTRVRDNYDWLIYRQLAKYFRDNPSVTFQIPDAPECQYEIYNVKFALSHGDEFTGGNGIGGMAVPIMRGDAKQQKRASATNQPYHVRLIGHWHNRLDFGSVRVNGSLKGYDEYARGMNFDFQLPQQDLFVTTPERGITISTPVYVRDKREKW